MKERKKGEKREKQRKERKKKKVDGYLYKHTIFPSASHTSYENKIKIRHRTSAASTGYQDGSPKWAWEATVTSSSR